MPAWRSFKFRVGRTRSGVPILVHWSVPAICLFLLGTGVDRILTAASAMTAYLITLVTHEIGHQFVAERRRCRVRAIEIYPLHAWCRYEPGNRLDEAVVAWGGALAQLTIGIPAAAFVVVAGYTQFQPVNALLAVLGFVGPSLALFNLLPIAPLDGHLAWRALPMLWPGRQRKPRPRNDQTAMEALEEALRKAKRGGGA